MGSSKSKNKKTDNDDLEEEKEKIISLEEIDKLMKKKDESIKKECELDFEIWYNILKNHTMKTHLLQLTNTEAMAIVAKCENVYNTKVYKIGQNPELNENIENVLNELSKKIDGIITENNYSENGVFIRYSHRSPKDAVFKIEKDKFCEEYKKIALKLWNEDKELTGYNDKELILNAALRGLVLTASKFQCIKSGKTAMNVAGHSKRVHRDFKVGELDNGENFKPFCIIREFYHCIEFESEFRCFIMKNELTVITQYHSLCFVNKLLENKDKIKKSIINYWSQTVHPLMKENDIQSYVMDIAWIKNKDDEKKENDIDYQWIVIELNPMGTNCGSGLFDWQKEYKLFLNPPTDFRVRETMYNMTPKQLEDGMEVLQQIVAFLTDHT